jgi:pyruvate formate lyase activating enzyme
VKGLIFDIRRFSVNDGPGIRTTVFFKGCPLNCQWCHNPESRVFAPEPVVVTDRLEGREYRHPEQIGRWMTVAEVMTEVEKERIFFESSGGGVTFSGGEPLLQPEFLSELAAACRKAEIRTALDTSGYCDPAGFAERAAEVDLVLFDIKVTEPSRHEKWTGFANDPILENLGRLDRIGTDYIIRIPLVPGVNDTEKELTDLKEILRPLDFRTREIHLLPYHPMGRHKLKRLGLEDRMGDVETPPMEWVEHRADDLRQAGYIVKIGG